MQIPRRHPVIVMRAWRAATLARLMAGGRLSSLRETNSKTRMTMHILISGETTLRLNLHRGRSTRSYPGHYDDVKRRRREELGSCINALVTVAHHVSKTRTSAGISRRSAFEVQQVCSNYIKFLTMRFTVLCVALCAPSALAFPWVTPEGMKNLLNHPEARREISRRLKELDNRVPEQSQHHEIRQLGTGLLDGIGSLLNGTLEAILDNVLGLIPTPGSVNGLKRFPEGIWLLYIAIDILSPLCAKLLSAYYPFRPPGPTDQRGPCPGLNTLANHGYIPRTGIATIGQINAATATVFNLGADLSTLLSTGGAIDGGDIFSQTMSIGGPDNRVGLLNGALNGIFGTPSGIAGHGKNNANTFSLANLHSLAATREIQRRRCLGYTQRLLPRR